MSTRIGINGFGRVGRSFLRIAFGTDLEVVAVNDLADTATLAHLLEYDSTYGRFQHDIGYDKSSISVDGHRIAITAEADPAALQWCDVDVDIVIESTGRFRHRDDAGVHIKGGARKVLLSAPGKNADFTVVMGVNEHGYQTDLHDVISSASCTTNCVVPMVKVLTDAFGVRKGFLTSIHAYTGDQVLLDGPHTDLHRGRAATNNIIPTSTGAARAVTGVIASLAHHLDGVAVRVPVEDGSLADLTVILDREAEVGEINDMFAAAAAGPYKGILRYNDDPIVSRDIIGDPASCVFDSTLTQADGELVKVFGWYDNEWGYTSRLVDLARYVADRL